MPWPGTLGMAQFAVQGTSAGGPYALACAVLMPDQVRAVILTSAGGRISEAGGLDGMPEDIAEGWRQEWRDPEGARDLFVPNTPSVPVDQLTGEP